MELTKEELKEVKEALLDRLITVTNQLAEYGSAPGNYRRVRRELFKKQRFVLGILAKLPTR